MATTSATGSSGLDVASIVSQLMTVEQRPLTAMAKKEASYQAKLSAYGSIKGALSGFQSAVAGLSDISKFQGLTASSSDSTMLTASAASTAAAGTYAINVTSLAQSQKLVALGHASQTSAIGLGGATTLTFDFGTIAGNTFNATTGKYGTALSASTTNGGTTVTVASTANLAVGATIAGAGIPVGATIASITDATNFVISAPATATGAGVALQAGATFTSNGSGIKTVSINATNNSLQGIRDAINAAHIGVTATIINDGSANPYRLSLSSGSNGISNSVKISVAGDATVGTLLAQDPANATGQNLSETVTAQNTNFTVNGVAVSKTSNSVSDVIQGVTLNLLKPTTTPINLSVAQNTATISTAVSGFVKAYNDLHTALKSVSSYDPATKKGAILQGDLAVRTIETQVRGMLNTAVGSAGALTTLSQIGVTFQKDGSLALDSTKLNTAITNNSSDIAALFAKVGKASDSLVTYISGTPPGSYAVNVSQLATQGNIIGLGAVGTTTIAAGGNDTLNVTVNGVSATVTLAAGTYTAATLAAEVQAKINGASALSAAGASVAVTQAGGIFTLTSNSYGSTSSVAIAGNGASNLLGGAPVPTAGLDVAGTIDGLAATGSGQFLTATGNAAGLKIQINGGALGARGTVNSSQGYAYTLNELSTTLLASNGTLDGKTTGVSNSIKDIGKQRDALNVRLADIQKNYTKQFSALDVMLSNMGQTSAYLTQQLANLPKPY